jgi:putative phage-type endonuclease
MGTRTTKANEMIAHNPIPGPYPYTPEWFELRVSDPSRKRPVIIGASNAAAVVGASKYKTRLQLYLELRGQMKPHFSDEQKENMYWGSKLESAVMDTYSERAGVEIEQNVPCYFHPIYDWMAATPDAIAHDSDEYGVEAKTSGFRMHDSSGEDPDQYGEEGTDQVPIIYSCQAQWQMAVMGWPKVVFPVLFDGRKFRVYTVERDESIIAKLIAAGADMARRVLETDPPEPDYSHDGTADAIRALYGRDEDATVALDDDLDQVVWQLKELSRQSEELDSRKLILQNRLLEAMGSAVKAVLPNGQKVSRTMVAESYVTESDVAALAAKVGEIKRRGYERLNLPRSKKGEK